MWRRIVLLISVISLLVPQVHGLVPHHHHNNEGEVARCHDPAPPTSDSEEGHGGLDDSGDIHDLAAHLDSSPEKPKVKSRTVVAALLLKPDFSIRFIYWPPTGGVADTGNLGTGTAPAGCFRNRAPPFA